MFPEGSDSGAQNFGASQGEADDFLKSKAANQDTEIFGTEVGVADAMRFKGAGRCFRARGSFLYKQVLVSTSALLMQLLR